jgi:hypothetical protein
LGNLGILSKLSGLDHAVNDHHEPTSALQTLTQRHSISILVCTVKFVIIHRATGMM